MENNFAVAGGVVVVVVVVVMVLVEDLATNEHGDTCAEAAAAGDFLVKDQV